jgi:hypothetical protein
MGPSLGRGGREARIWWSHKKFEEQSINNTYSRRNWKAKYFFGLQVAYLWQGVHGVEERSQTN